MADGEKFLGNTEVQTPSILAETHAGLLRLAAGRTCALGLTIWQHEDRDGASLAWVATIFPAGAVDRTLLQVYADTPEALLLSVAARLAALESAPAPDPAVVALGEVPL